MLKQNRIAMQNAHEAPPAAGNRQAKIPPYQLIYPLPWPAIKAVGDPSTKQEEFGHDRDKGQRTHAAIDLAAPVGTPVLAMAAGTVLRITPYFYQRTGEIEIAHPGLGIVRYGELSPDSAKSVWLGRDLLMERQHVQPGQVIGAVGRRVEKTDKNGHLIYAKRSMLHLELYSDWEDDDVKAHALTDPANQTYDKLPENLAHRNYQRRHDLLDPTNVVAHARVQELEKLGLYDLLTSSNKPAPSLQELMQRAILLRIRDMPFTSVPSKK